MKLTLRLLLLAGLIAGGYYFYQHRAEAAKDETDAALSVAAVALGRIEEAVTAQGKIETRDYVDVGAQVSGQLSKLYVEIGDTVKQGDLLAEIDPRVYESRVAADEAQLKTLQAQLAEQQAQITLARQVNDRNKRLIKSSAVSQEVLEDSDSALKVALARAASLRAQIEQAQSTLDGDRTNLGFTKIYAPMSGTVVSQTTREGQTINAVQQAPVIVQIADLDAMTVRAQVAEADVMRIKVGTPVYFTTLGSLDRRWEGKVRQILPSPEIINDVVLYNALVDVDNRDRQLMTSMSTQMFFVLAEADNVPLIPVSALGKRLPTEDDNGAQAYVVRVRNAGGVAERTVHIGMMNRTQAEVRSGLAVGDEVVVPDTRQSRARFTPPPML